MSLLSWSRLLLIIMAPTAVLFAVLDIWQPFHEGTYGMSYTLVDRARPTVLVRAVDAGSAAASAGIAAGDLLTVRGSYLDLASPASLQPIDLIDRGRLVRLVAHPRPRLAFDMEWGLIRLLTVGVAMLCLVRQPNNRGALALAGFLIGMAHLYDWSCYAPPFNVLGLLSRTFGTVVGFPLFIVFIVYATDVEGRLRRSSLLAAAVLTACYGLVVSLSTALYFHSFYWRPLTWAQTAIEVGIFGTGLFLLIRQSSLAPPQDRERVRWMIATLATSLSGGLVFLILSRWDPSIPYSETFALTTVLLPIGLAYSILRHHLLDITFAINVVLLYGLITSIVVPAFGLIEWLISQSLQAVVPLLDDKHGIAEPISAVIIFVALRYVHEWVDTFLDHLVFRKREERLNDLHAFASDLCIIEQLDTLARLIPLTVNRTMRISWSAVYLATSYSVLELASDPLPGAECVIDLDDPAVLRLRAEGRPLDLERVPTRLTGATAFPMSFGRRFYGILLVGPTVSGLSLSPDEMKAIQGIATAAAMARSDIIIDEYARKAGESDLPGAWSGATRA